MKEYLGVQVNVDDDLIPIDQSQYAKEIPQKCGHENAHAVGNHIEVNIHLRSSADDDGEDTTIGYLMAIGMLIYLATCTRPDLAYSLGRLSRFVSAPKKQHVGCVKRVLCYLTGTVAGAITELSTNVIKCMIVTIKP